MKTNPTPQTNPRPAPEQIKPAVALWRAIFEAIPPLPEISISKWAAKHRRLSSEGSHQPGRFVAFPYQVEPMDAPLAKDVAETVLWWAAQMSKSETLNNISGYYMHADPAPQLLVQPTVDLAKEYSKDRIAPMIRDTPPLRRLVKDPRTRDSSNTTLGKRYPGGSLVLVGANAPSGLAGRPRRVILQDEIDRFPTSAGSEGDPCSLADKRAESFPNAVFVKSSTATVKGLSRIEKLYEQSDKRNWFCPCRSCGAEFVLLWKHVGWPENKPEEAWIECPECHAKHGDEQRVAMVRRGKWKATAKFKGIRGFWINGLNTLFKAHKGFRDRMHEFVAKFLEAKDNGPEFLKVWINTFLAETYEEEAAAINDKELVERAEDYGPLTLPVEVLIVTASFDTHRNRIECEIKGWGVGEESWGIRKLVIDGDVEKDEPWKMLDDALLEEFEREDGARLKIARAFGDMGYKDKRVLWFCAPRLGRGVYPCKGINRVGLNTPPLLPAKPNRNNKARIPHWNVGVTVAKTTLYDRLAMKIPGPRTMHFPRDPLLGYDADYFKQFTVERRFTRYAFGQPYYIFEKENSSQRNEALDLNVYNLAALNSLFPIDWHKLAERIAGTAPDPGAKKEVPPAEQTPTTDPELARKLTAKIGAGRRSGFVGRWRR